MGFLGTKVEKSFLKGVVELLLIPRERNREGLGWGAEDSILSFSSALYRAVEDQMTLAICGVVKSREENEF